VRPPPTLPQQPAPGVTASKVSDATEGLWWRRVEQAGITPGEPVVKAPGVTPRTETEIRLPGAQTGPGARIDLPGPEAATARQMQLPGAHLPTPRRAPGAPDAVPLLRLPAPEPTQAPQPLLAAGLHPIGYGDGPLSRLAQQLRLQVGQRRGNVAVFEFDTLPKEFVSLLEREAGESRGVRQAFIRIDGTRVAFLNIPDAAHSERLAHLLIVQGRKGGLTLSVRRIYSEYNPCTDKCLPLIQEAYPSAEISYSFRWERWGRETPERNAAIDALFEGR
jgi:hypothetical protein